MGSEEGSALILQQPLAIDCADSGQDTDSNTRPIPSGMKKALPQPCPAHHPPEDDGARTAATSLEEAFLSVTDSQRRQPVLNCI